MNFEINFSPDIAYCRSKIANVLFTRELQARLKNIGKPGLALSLHPGVIPTEISRERISKATNIAIRVVFFPLFLICFKTNWEGAQTTLYLALESDEKLEGGEYYSDCKRANSSEFSSNMENAKRLWKLSEEMLGIKFDL